MIAHRSIKRISNTFRTSMLFSNLKEAAPLIGRIDKFKSIYLGEDPKQLPSNLEDLKAALKKSLSIWKKEAVTGVWIKLFKDKNLHLIPAAIEQGFEPHHTQRDHIVLNKWLPDRPNLLPEYTSLYIGAGAAIFNEKNEILLVQECEGFKKGLWGLPGGQLGSNESIEEGIKREVLEETGMKAEIVKLLSLRELGELYFGKREYYFLFLMKALNYNIKIDDTEISDCKWHSMAELEVLIKNREKIETQVDTLTICYNFKKLQDTKDSGNQEDLFGSAHLKHTFYGRSGKSTVYAPALYLQRFDKFNYRDPE